MVDMKHEKGGGRMNGEFNKPHLMGNCERCYYATDKSYRMSWFDKGEAFICHRYPQEVEKEPGDYCGEFAWNDSKNDGGQMSELKPCPFCGARGSVEEEGPIGGYAVRCGNCGSQTPIYLRADLAIKAWNRRAERTTSMYRDKHGIWHCENCEHGADRLTGSDGELDAWGDSWAPNYCPNCGAKVVEQ